MHEELRDYRETGRGNSSTILTFSSGGQETMDMKDRAAFITVVGQCFLEVKTDSAKPEEGRWSLQNFHQQM